MKKKPTLIMLIGLPGSGKSTYGQKLATEINATILSSDSLRKEMYGNENHQDNNEEVFAELHKRCKAELKKLNNIIYDATNVNQRKRVAFLRELKGIDCYKKAIVFATPYELCVKNAVNRDRQVPEYVIKRIRANFQLPLYNEGWSDIEVVWNMEDMKFDIAQFLDDAIEFNQKNSHHSFSLDVHMATAASHLINMGYLPEKNNSHLYAATRLHDIGKPDTQTFTDKHGNPSEDAHYYGHNFVGAYNALFYLKQYENGYYSDKDILHICTLIQYHMHPYLGWKDSEKAKNRDKRLLGERWFNEVMILHECDVAAH